MNKLILLITVFLVLSPVISFTSCDGEEASPTPSGGVTSTPTIQPMTFKLVSSMPADSTGGQAYFHFADLVEEYTDGRLMIDVYPGSQLFPATEEWEAVSTGAVDIFGDSSYFASSYVPDMMIFYVDGAFESYEHAYAVLEESEVPRILAEQVEEAGPVKLLGILPAGMTLCVINSVRETSELSDLAGLRCQSSPGAPPLPLYEYTGMTAVPISLEETSTAFIQGVLDAVHQAPGIIKDLRMYETGKHMLCRYSMFATLLIIMNNDSWNALPADIQDIILNEVIPETYDFFKTIYRDSEDTAIDLITQNVETVHWVEQADLDAYLEYLPTHPVYRMQMLMVDKDIKEIIDELRPGGQ